MLEGDIKSAGFEVNPNDPCVENKMVNGSQMPIIWHVDDFLKISHQDGLEITKVIKWFGKIYGDIKVKRGRKHQYLGMGMDFEERGIVRISMILYVKEIIKTFLKKWKYQLQQLLQQKIYFGSKTNKKQNDFQRYMLFSFIIMSKNCCLSLPKY